MSTTLSDPKTDVITRAITAACALARDTTAIPLGRSPFLVAHNGYVAVPQAPMETLLNSQTLAILNSYQGHWFFSRDHLPPLEMGEQNVELTFQVPVWGITREGAVELWTFDIQRSPVPRTGDQNQDGICPTREIVINGTRLPVTASELELELETFGVTSKQILIQLKSWLTRLDQKNKERDRKVTFALSEVDKGLAEVPMVLLLSHRGKDFDLTDHIKTARQIAIIELELFSTEVKVIHLRPGHEDVIARGVLMEGADRGRNLSAIFLLSDAELTPLAKALKKAQLDYIKPYPILRVHA
ncbi:MAG TPA: hypothetical protein VLA04_01300 [Verrucomicrobiae bacterium]|nr:hypothetical protein [Verrucomicrobiae bacterium]